jgi:hypothetical protein
MQFRYWLLQKIVTGGQTIHFAFVPDIEKKSALKYGRDV